MKQVMLAAAVVLVMIGNVRAQDVSPIVLEGIVEAPLDEVWAAWATSEGLRSWMAPHADVDFRIGGLMRANYNATGTLGDGQTIENTILSFEPRRMISIKVAKPPDGFPFPNAIRRMWSVIYFAEAGPARTHVRAVSLGFDVDDESQKMRAFFAQGNDTTLKRLQNRFAKAAR
jgi:uncharacterized protein YndB with AHSA1/START domain